MSTKKMVLLALLIAMQVVFSEFFAIKLPTLKISLSIISLTVMAISFGPIYTAVGMVVADLLGILIFPPQWPVYFGFFISNALTGLFFGLLLYQKYNINVNKKIYLLKIILACFLVNMGVNTILNTIWLSNMFGDSFIALLPVRFVKNVITMLINIVIVSTITPYINYILNKNNLALGGEKSE